MQTGDFWYDNIIFLYSIGKRREFISVASLIRLRHLVRFMLKVKQLVLLDGNTLDDVEMIPTDTGYLVNIEVSGKKCLREIPRERVSYIDYEDSKTIDLLKGIALVPIVEDMEEVDAIYEEYGDLSALIAQLEAEEVAQAESNESTSPLTKNPYGDA